MFIFNKLAKKEKMIALNHKDSVHLDPETEH